MTPRIAIVGRPNVGKSTLFNRLAGKRLALVHETPGLTRDRKEAEAVVGDHTVQLIDTAGLEEAEKGSVTARMREQTEAAIEDADILLFVIDARTGVVAADEIFASLARVAGKPIILIANKCEGHAAEAGFYDAYSLGLGEPMAISAEHGEGLGELYRSIDDACASLEEQEEGSTAEDQTSDADKPLRLAVVGRPNAGKSTLVNALLGEDRMITGPEAGITRDSVSAALDWNGKGVRLYDTAGLRKKARVAKGPESLSVGDTLRAIRFAEVVVLMIDAEIPFEKQDLQIADLIVQEGRALVIAVNKWDQVKDKAALLKELQLEVERLIPQVRGVPLITISALRNSGLGRLMTAVFDMYDLWNRRLPTAALNKWLLDAQERHPPPAVRGKRIRLRYMTQPNARPPTFVVFSSRAEKLPESYRRYLVQSLRSEFDLPGIPIRLGLRKGKNPYAS